MNLRQGSQQYHFMFANQIHNGKTENVEWNDEEL